MTSDPLDEVDKSIIHFLQQDARNTTAADIAEHVDVTPNTVRNRIQHLEESGIIEGYIPIINYERAKYPLVVDVICTAPMINRKELAEDALNLNGVVRVQERMSGRRNVIITVVASEGDELTEVATSLHNIGFTVEAKELVKNSLVQPFDNFSSNNDDE